MNPLRSGLQKCTMREVDTACVHVSHWLSDQMNFGEFHNRSQRSPPRKTLLISISKTYLHLKFIFIVEPINTHLWEMPYRIISVEKEASL